MSTIVVVLVIVLAVILAVRRICRNRREGKNSCGGDCSACGGCPYKK